MGQRHVRPKMQGMVVMALLCTSRRLRNLMATCMRRMLESQIFITMASDSKSRS